MGNNLKNLNSNLPSPYHPGKKFDFTLTAKLNAEKSTYNPEAIKAEELRRAEADNREKFHGFFKNYFSRPEFSKTELKPEDFTEGLLYASKKYPKMPLEDLAKLMVTQSQFETFLGTKGRGGKPGHNNPFNVGEYDTYTAMTFKSPEEGIKAYIDLIGTNYLPYKN